MKSAAAIRIGTSGYQYNHWRDVFYPANVPKIRWFEYYAGHFDTVELNTTFYHLPRAETFVNWHDRAPEKFLYILKFSRYGTHLKRLKDPQESIGAFYERARALKEFLGPILVQLPPRWDADAPRLDDFFAAAREIAGKEQRWAVEFRDISWLTESIYDVLRKRKVALCIHDIIKPHPQVITADWVYLRFHGADTWGNYSDEQLEASADQIRGHVKAGRDVYAYFNNDAHGYAVANAKTLKEKLGNSRAATSFP
jgi:uncharacterized protein YecE (DUF72 family)